MTTSLLLLVLALALVAACGVFVAAEFSFVTVDRAQVEHDAASGDAGALGLQKALRTLSTQLSPLAAVPLRIELETPQQALTEMIKALEQRSSQQIEPPA